MYRHNNQINLLQRIGLPGFIELFGAFSCLPLSQFVWQTKTTTNIICSANKDALIAIDKLAGVFDKQEIV